MSTPKTELLKLGRDLGYEVRSGSGRHVLLVHPTTGVRVPLHKGTSMSTGLVRKIAGQLRRGTTQTPTRGHRQ